MRQNFILNVLDGAFFAFGLSFVSRTTVLPLFVKKIGGSNIAVGMIPVLWTLGFNAPQIFIANYAQHVPSKKRLVLKTAIAQRVPWLLLALGTYFWMENISTQAGLLLFFSGFALAAFGGSLNLPGWFDLVSKVTPVRLRGRLFAVRSILGAGFAIIGGWCVERILSTWPYPDGFALLLGIAFGLMLVSHAFQYFFVERELEVPNRRIRYKEFLRRLPRILRTQRNYRNFLIADALLITATMADAFYTVYAFDRFMLDEGYVGRFTMVAAGSVMVGSLLFGYLADRAGHRINLMIAGLTTVGACIMALLAPSPTVYFLAFIGSAFTLRLRKISRMPIVAEICGEKDRPTYAALTNMLTAPFVLSGLLGGFVANQLGYEVVFVSAAVAAGMAVLWLALMVNEPRTEIAQTA